MPLRFPQLPDLKGFSVAGLFESHFIWIIFFSLAVLFFLINYAFTVYHLKTFGVGIHTKALAFIFTVGSLILIIFLFAIVFGFSLVEFKNLFLNL